MAGLAPILAALLLAACGSERDVVDGALTELEIRGGALTATPVELPRPISPENDEHGFAVSIDLRFHAGRLVVLENQNSRLVLFDTSLVAIGAIGREGAGPGEMRGVMHLDVWRREYAISEINNGRVSVFDADGTFLRAVSVPDGGSEFAFASNGDLLVNATSPDHYLHRVSREGLRRPFGARPIEHYPPELATEPTPRGMGRERVATVQSDVYVLDVLLGGLIRFDSSGTRTGTQLLPGWLREGLIRATERVAADFGAGGGRVWTVSVTDLSATDDGRLLLLFPIVERTFGLLIDPRNGVADRLEWAPDGDEVARGVGGGVGVVRAGRLYRGSGDEVRVYDLVSGR